MALSAQQIRAARALLDWSQTRLAEASLLSLRTIKRVEAGDELIPSADMAIRRAFEDQGVVFVASAADLDGIPSPLGVVLRRG